MFFTERGQHHLAAGAGGAELGPVGPTSSEEGCPLRAVDTAIAIAEPGGGPPPGPGVGPARPDPTAAVAGTDQPSAATAGPRVDQLDVVRPLTNLGVITSHATLLFTAASAVAPGGLLVLTHVTREVYFVVSAFVLTYTYFDRPEVGPGSFWRRRFRSMGIPYLIWTVAYFILDFFLYHPKAAATPLSAVQDLGYLALTGTDHLYYLVVVMEFYLVFPFFVRLLRRTRGAHGWILAASVAVQVGLLSLVSFGPAPWWMLGKWTTRELWTYQLYLVIGAVAGANHRRVHAWIWAHRRALAVSVASVAVGTELWYLGVVGHGVLSVPQADSPFQPEVIALDVAAVVGLYLVGTWWTSRDRPGRAGALVRSGARSAFGHYLIHYGILQVLAVAGLGAVGLPWPVVVALAVLISLTGAHLLTALLARTPASVEVVGQRRMPGFRRPARFRRRRTPEMGAGADLQPSSARMAEAMAGPSAT